jgi:hypothetical protein
LSKISIELALRGTFSTLGVYNNTPYLEVDFTHQSGLDTSTLAYFEVKKSVIFIKINEFIQLEKFQKINEFLLNAAVIYFQKSKLPAMIKASAPPKKYRFHLRLQRHFMSLLQRIFCHF